MEAVLALVFVVGLGAGRGLRVLTPWVANVKAAGIPFRWPWLENTTGAALALVAGVAPRAPWFVLALLLLAVTATDAHCKLIPNRVTYPGAAIGLLFSMLSSADVAGFLSQADLVHRLGLAGDLAGLALGAMGAAVGFLVLEIVRRAMGAVVGMEVLGMGDSKLLLMIGAFLGPQMVLLSLAPALLFGIGLGVPYTKLAKTPHLPFGPALAFGGYSTMLFGKEIAVGWVWATRLAQDAPPAVHIVLSLVLLGVAIGLLVRVRRRRREYTEQIEQEYDQFEQRD